MINFYRAFRYGFWERERKWRNNHYGPIKVQTLLIWGEEDDFLEKALALNTRKYVTDLTIRFLPKTSHWVQQERPEEVNQLIGAFILKKGLSEEVV